MIQGKKNRKAFQTSVLWSLVALAGGLVALPLPGQALNLSFYVKLNAAYAGRSFDYKANWSFERYLENGSVSGAYAVKTGGFTIEPGLGVLLTPNLGIELLFVPCSKSFDGTFGASFPHPFYYDKARQVEWNRSGLAYGENELAFNAVGRYPFLQGKMDVYLSAGGSYFIGVKVEALSDLSWQEVGYPYTDVATTPTYKKFSRGVLGFNAGGGADFFFIKGLGANIHVRYASASWTLEVRPGVNVTIRPGGVRISAGLKYFFQI